MMGAQTITYSFCPACGSPVFYKALSVTDFLVSGEVFDICECENCQLRFTQGVPDGKGIAHYYRSDDYISHTETSKGVVNRLYHFVRKLTLSEKRRLILSVTQMDKGRVLDIGAGTGAFLDHMQKNGWQTTGIEPDESARFRASQVHKINLLPPEAMLRFPENCFDVITLWHVLEHVHDLHETLDRLRKILKPHGRIFIAVPNHTCYDAQYYRNFWAAYDVPRHLYHFSPESMFKLLSAHQLQLNAIRGMWYDSFYVSMLSEKYKKQKRNLVRGIVIGFLSNLRAFVNRERCSSLIYIIGKK